MSCRSVSVVYVKNQNFSGKQYSIVFQYVIVERTVESGENGKVEPFIYLEKEARS